MLGDDAGHAPVLGDQVGERGVEPYRHSGLQEAHSQSGRKRLPHREQLLPGDASGEPAAAEAEQPGHAVRVPGDEAQPAVVRLGDRDAQRGRAVGRFEVGEFLAEQPPVEWHGLDRSSGSAAARSFGVVVGVARHPLEPQGRGPLDERDHLGPPLEEGVPQLGRDDVAHDGFEVGTRLLGGVRIAPPAVGRLQHLVVRDPDPAAGPGGRPAELRGLLQHDGPQALFGGGERGGHPGGAAADHDHVVLAVRGLAVHVPSEVKLVPLVRAPARASCRHHRRERVSVLG